MFLQQKGYLPTDTEAIRPWFEACGVPLPESLSKPVTARDFVALVVHKYGMPADRAWQMTIPELVLMLVPPGDKEQSSSAMEAGVNCYLDSERQKLLDRLTVEEQIELEDLVTELT